MRGRKYWYVAPADRAEPLDVRVVFILDGTRCGRSGQKPKLVAKESLRINHAERKAGDLDSGRAAKSAQ